MEVNSEVDQSSAYSESESFTSDNSIEYHFLQTGIGFPINDHEAKLIDFALQHPEIWGKMIKDRKEMIPLLSSHRNVNLEESATPDTFDLEALPLDTGTEVEEYHERLAYRNVLWEHDRIKCLSGGEAIFQRSLMMSMIDRYRIFTDPGNSLDFSVEESWLCPPMPTRGLLSKDQQIIALPSPDLCVCFRTEKVLSQICRRGLSQAMLKMIMVGGRSIPQCKRSFPFLILEAKNGATSHSRETALAQCLNTASQALHNMYEFFREAGMTSEFFDNVRFFTVAATASGCIFRMHRAEDGGEDSQIVDDYCLAFEYNEIGDFTAQAFTQQAILDRFERIIWGYGPHLRQLIEKACLQIERIIKAKGYNHYLLKRDESYYRHGQVTPKKDSKGSVSPSQTPKHGRDQAEPTPASTIPSRGTSIVSQNSASNNSGSKKRTRQTDCREHKERRQATDSSEDDYETPTRSFQNPRRTSPGFSFTCARSRSISQAKR